MFLLKHHLKSPGTRRRLVLSSATDKRRQRLFESATLMSSPPPEGFKDCSANVQSNGQIWNWPHTKLVEVSFWSITVPFKVTDKQEKAVARLRELAPMLRGS